MATTKINPTLGKVFTAIHSAIYKLSGGRLLSRMGGAQVVLLTTTGRKSGKSRTSPLLGISRDDGWMIVASNSGHDHHPAWYLNLQANADASLKVGADDIAVTARVLEGDERQAAWDEIVESYSDYEEYRKVTDRQIPVVLLERR